MIWLFFSLAVTVNVVVQLYMLEEFLAPSLEEDPRKTEHFHIFPLPCFGRFHEKGLAVHFSHLTPPDFFSWRYTNDAVDIAPLPTTLPKLAVAMRVVTVGTPELEYGYIMCRAAH
jgi:hypothetical protein